MSKPNDIEFLNGPVEFEKEINCSADYIDTVTISKQPRTDYEYHEALDLSGGELTITYDSGHTEIVPMTDEKVSASGFYGANGEFPAENSEVEVTVTYTAEEGVYDLRTRAAHSSQVHLRQESKNFLRLTLLLSIPTAARSASPAR